MAVRLFAAIVPPPQVLDHAQSALAFVREGPGAALRWVPRENLHLTVAFFGEIPDGAAPDLQDALAAELAGLGIGELDLRGSGSFLGRTLWVGVGGDVAGARRVMDAAGRAGGLPEQRERLHMTVARNSRRSRGADLGGPTRALAVYRGPVWQPREVLLMSSRLGEGRSGGPHYEALDSVLLG